MPEKIMSTQVDLLLRTGMALQDSTVQQRD